ncbi:hypothetical protein JXM67_12905 [candidate division WOR-3 bacterium]|nr:hypothetical protein [candidate division WOR-3 bacterium]
MGSSRPLLSRVSPVMLILVTVVFVTVAPFLSVWMEFAGAGLCCFLLALLAGTGWRFWGRYIKIALPLVVIAFAFNWVSDWIMGWISTGVFDREVALAAVWPAVIIGLRFSISIFFSLLLVHVCSHEELVWGLARLSDRIFRTPVVGEVIALAVLSVPFFAEALSRVKRFRDIPAAIAGVFAESQRIVSHPVKIGAKKPGWVLLSASIVVLAAAVVIK